MCVYINLLKKKSLESMYIGGVKGEKLEAKEGEQGNDFSTRDSVGLN